ncbi:hypothetical protein KUCAC02_002241, partial [Chaenocephalus aceratus]
SCVLSPPSIPGIRVCWGIFKTEASWTILGAIGGGGVLSSPASSGLYWGYEPQTLPFKPGPSQGTGEAYVSHEVNEEKSLSKGTSQDSSGVLEEEHRRGRRMLHAKEEVECQYTHPHHVGGCFPTAHHKHGTPFSTTTVNTPIPLTLQ